MTTDGGRTQHATGHTTHPARIRRTSDVAADNQLLGDADLSALRATLQENRRFRLQQLGEIAGGSSLGVSRAGSTPHIEVSRKLAVAARAALEEIEAAPAKMTVRQVQSMRSRHQCPTPVELSARRCLALDLGSAQTRAWMPGRGLVVDAPTITPTEPDSPVRRGSVVDAVGATRMLDRRLNSRGAPGHRPTLIITTMPVLSTDADRRADQRVGDRVPGGAPEPRSGS